jgi:hypothetical protein
MTSGKATKFEFSIMAHNTKIVRNLRDEIKQT